MLVYVKKSVRPPTYALLKSIMAMIMIMRKSLTKKMLRFHSVEKYRLKDQKNVRG